MSAFAPLRPTLGLVRTAAQASRSFSSSASRSVARMIITGRLAAEPELQATASGQDVIRYSIGTSYGSKENRQTSWFRVASFLPEGSQRDFILGLPKGYVLILGWGVLRVILLEQMTNEVCDLVPSSTLRAMPACAATRMPTARGTPI